MNDQEMEAVGGEHETTNDNEEEEEDNVAFVDMSSAVEVNADFENAPMEEEDEDETKIEDDGIETNTDNSPAPITDMAKQVLTHHTGSVYAVTANITNDGALVMASGGGDDKSFLSTNNTNNNTTAAVELNASSHKFTDSVSCTAFNPTQPHILAVGNYDGTIQLWDTSSSSPTHQRQLDGPSDIEFLSWHPKGGTVLLAGSTDGTVWMWFTPTGKCLQVFVGHESDVTCGGFTPDGKWAVSGGVDGTVRVWAPKKGVARHVFRNGGDGVKFSEGGIMCLGLGGGGDGLLGIVGGEDGFAWVVHLGNKRVISCLNHYDAAAAASSEGMEEEDEGARCVGAVGFAGGAVNVNWCATGGVNGVLKVWDLTNNQCRQICVHGPQVGITRLSWHPTKPMIYTSASDGNIRLWDVRTGECLQTLTGHTDMINDLHIIFADNNAHLDKDIIVTGSDDHTVRVFEASS